MEIREITYPIPLSEVVRQTKDPEMGTIPDKLDCVGLPNYCERLARRAMMDPREHGIILDYSTGAWHDLSGIISGQAGSVDFSSFLKELNRPNILVLHNHVPTVNTLDYMKDRDAGLDIASEDYLSITDFLRLISAISTVPPRIFGVVNGGSFLFGVRTKETPAIDSLTTLRKASFMKDFISNRIGANLNVIRTIMDAFLKENIFCSGDLKNYYGDYYREFNIAYAKRNKIALFQVNNYVHVHVAHRTA